MEDIRELSNYEFGATSGQAINLLINTNKLTLKGLREDPQRAEKQVDLVMQLLLNLRVELKKKYTVR